MLDGIHLPRLELNVLILYSNSKLEWKKLVNRQRVILPSE